MALVFADRVRETTSTAGTGTFSLLGAVNSCQSFSAIGNGNTTYYTAVSQVGTEWEVGLGTYNAGTLTRNTILASSNGGAIVNFSAGTKDIFCDYPAGKAVLVDGSGNTYAPNIGGTTASAGTFTNVNLKGTGQNLWPSTTTFGSGWGIGSGTNTLSGATTDPFGGTSVYKLVANSGFDPNTGSSAILSCAYTTFPVGATYTQSIYFKAAETNALRIRNNFTGEIYTFTIGTTPVATSGVLNPQLISSGNGWYRAVWTYPNGNVAGTGRADIWSYRLAITGDGVSGVYISSPQLEYGTAVGTYIPNTTAAAIYGVPAISFDGVSSIALDSKGNLILQPATGAALQAQQADSTATGGNARGTNAVDWQTLRSTATKVASGIYSTIAGGQQHTASGTGAFVGGGYQNTCSAYEGAVVGGSSNTASNFQNFIGGGTSNNVSGSWAAIVGGFGNTSAGQYNFVGGGYFNAGTSASAVTSQSATMNGTTAVTLSGSNASIKVGQYIAGTSIPSGTYVAAISGTSLTLSQAASGSTTNTISFYAPHGVVVGGGNNQATGAYSFIGGGGDAGTAANRNSASGDWSVVVGGRGNIASGHSSVVVGGGSDSTASMLGSTASGIASTISGGLGHGASGTGSTISGGYQHQANSTVSTVVGGRYGSTRGISGYMSLPACNNPIFSNYGVSQAGLLIVAKQTTNATATVLTSDGGAGIGNNQIILPNNSAYYFKGSVIANVTGAANGAAWSFEGAIMRGANAASTVLIGTVTLNRVATTAGASLWTVAITADTTNGGLAITVTGVAATTIRWVAKVETTEVTF